MTTTSGSDRPDIADRVRKLLAMAERTTNAREADAFSAKAADLIARYRLSPAALRDAEANTLGLREVPIGRGAYVRARLALLGAVADAYGGFVTFRSTDTGTVATLCGHTADLDAIEVLYTSLHTQMSSRAASQQRATGAATQRWRRSFMFGFAQQIAEMLTRVHHDAMEATQDATVLPVLRDRDAAVREFAEQQLGRIVSARPASPVGIDAVRSGRRAARDADIGRPRVPTQRALGAGRES